MIQLQIIVYITLGFALSFCGQKNELQGTENSSAANCVSTFFTEQYHYILNPQDDDRLEGNLSCVDDRLSVVENYLSQRQTMVRLEDFQIWLNKSFFSQKPLLSEYVASWLFFKTWIVGGDSKYLTLKEVKGLRKILKEWGIFLKRINNDLLTMTSHFSSSSRDLRKSYDHISIELNGFLEHFPDLISNFSFKTFAALMLFNPIDEESGIEPRRIELLQALVYLPNGQEKTLLSKDTAKFLIWSYYQFNKFQVEVGESLIKIIFKSESFIDYAISFLTDLKPVLDNVNVFDYKGFEYLSSYISKYYFEDKYSTDDVLKVFKVINRSYLTTNYDEYSNGFSSTQFNNLLKIFIDLRSYNKRVDVESKDLSNNWALYFLEKNRMQGFNIILNKEGRLTFSKKFMLHVDKETVKYVNFLSTSIQIILRSQAQYYVDALTEEEFQKLLADFKVFEFLWESRFVNNYYDYARSLGGVKQESVDIEQLFYFLTGSLQSEGLRDYNLSRALFGVTIH